MKWGGNWYTWGYANSIALAKLLYMHTVIRKPLTAAQLREIWLRNQNEDMLAVLWEVKRLRELVVRASHLHWTFREELKGEPCLEEDRPFATERELRRRANAIRNAD